MALGLPALPYRDRISKKTQVRFGGLDRRDLMIDGTLRDSLNLTCEYYPVLSVRGARKYAPGSIAAPHGITGGAALCYVSGTTLYYNGSAVGTVTAGKKRFAAMGDYIVVLPDKKYYNTYSGDFGTLEKTYTASAGQISFADGTYAGEPAEGNTLVTSGPPFDFNVGDAVTISGCITHPENNKTPVIREISADKKKLIFYEHTFTTGSESGAVTVKREVPDMDFVFSNDNRLWGCKDDTIYCSKLGDPFNWNVFDGVATDSFAVDTGSPGKFTGACSYLGYPMFFKEDQIFKVYGSKPSNFEVLASASLGVADGSGDSLAVAGEKLFYLSRSGPVEYSGGIPVLVGEALGELPTQGIAGSDGLRYYLCALQGGERRLYVYDTQRGMWQCESCTESGVAGFAYVVGQGLYMLGCDGTLAFIRGAAQPAGYSDESEVSSVAEFGDFTDIEANMKGVSKLQLRVELEAGATLDVHIMYDRSGEWVNVKSLSATTARSLVLPVVPRRCDNYRIKLSGSGVWRLFSLTRETYTGSDMK